MDDGTDQMASHEPITYVYGCSARNEQLLERARDEMLSFLQHLQNEDIRLSDICYTSTARRVLQSHRLSITAASLPQLVHGLETARIVEVPDQPPPVVFLFSGQGSQFVGMGQDLLRLLPTFQETVFRCHELLLGWGHPGCLDVIQPENKETLDIRDVCVMRSLQCGVFVLEVALARSLVRLGVQPALVAGHSLGEFAALVIAGVLDLESGLWLVAERARLIVEKCNLFQTSMLAINMPAALVRQDILRLEQFSQVSISCENSPSDCVVGGVVADLEQLEEYVLMESGRKATRLDVPVAYHSAALDKVLEELKTAAAKLSFAVPSIPIASNVLGRIVQAGERSVFNPEYIARHCKEVVAFSGSIKDALFQDEALMTARWIEIGPHPMLLPMVNILPPVSMGFEKTELIRYRSLSMGSPNDRPL